MVLSRPRIVYSTAKRVLQVYGYVCLVLQSIFQTRKSNLQLCPKSQYRLPEAPRSNKNTYCNQKQAQELEVGRITVNITRFNKGKEHRMKGCCPFRVTSQSPARPSFRFQTLERMVLAAILLLQGSCWCHSLSTIPFNRNTLILWQLSFCVGDH